MSTREGTCEDRIADHLTSRLATFAALAKAARVNDQDELDALTAEDRNEIRDAIGCDDLIADELAEAADTAIVELPLCVSAKKLYRIDLSTGGPGDWLEAEVDTEDHEIGRITYWFNDWFDVAHRVLEGDERDVAESFCQRFIEECW